MNIEHRIKICIEDPAATVATLQDLIDTIDITVDDIATSYRSAYRPSPGAVSQAQRLHAARSQLVDKLTEIEGKRERHEHCN